MRNSLPYSVLMLGFHAAGQGCLTTFVAGLLQGMTNSMRCGQICDKATSTMHATPTATASLHSIPMPMEYSCACPSPQVRPSEKFKFNFDWNADEDTSKDLNPLYANPHGA